MNTLISLYKWHVLALIGFGYMALSQWDYLAAFFHAGGVGQRVIVAAILLTVSAFTSFGIAFVLWREQQPAGKKS